MRLQTISGFKGIDRRQTFGDSLGLAYDMRNLFITPSGALKKRPSACHEELFSDIIDGLFVGNFANKPYIAVASGGYLHIRGIDSTEFDKNIGFIGYGEAMMFSFNGALYIKTREHYKKYDGNTLKNVDGYIPLVALSCNPDGSGVIFEQVNMLTPYRRQLFSADGVSVLYFLSEKGIESIESVKIDGVEYDGLYAFDPANDAVSFEISPKKGLNNLEITYKMPNDKCLRQRFLDFSSVMLFGGNSDGRAFLYGNESFPNYRIHSDLANGIPSVEYFPENAYTVIGEDAINCIVQQYDRQLIFTKSRAFYSYCELKTDSLGNVISSFPVFSLNGSKGCLIKTDGVVIDNRPVTLCDDGLNLWESTSLLNEKNAVNFSTPIDDLIKEAISNLSEIKMLDFQARRELWFIKSGTAYIYNYGIGSFYVYDGFATSDIKAYGDRIYFVQGGELKSFSYDEIGFSSDCVWESGFIKNGHNVGRLDLISLEADLYLNGSVIIDFEIEDSTQKYRRRFELTRDSALFRIAMRPSLKRVMPFKITIRVSGDGVFALHGLSIKTKQRERSTRNGILRIN